MYKNILIIFKTKVCNPDNTMIKTIINHTHCFKIKLQKIVINPKKI